MPLRTNPVVIKEIMVRTDLSYESVTILLKIVDDVLHDLGISRSPMVMISGGQDRPPAA